MDRITSKNEKIRLIQEKDECVGCGMPHPMGSCGDLKDPDWLPCCTECYESDKLNDWVIANNHKFSAYLEKQK